MFSVSVVNVGVAVEVVEWLLSEAKLFVFASVFVVVSGTVLMPSVDDGVTVEDPGGLFFTSKEVVVVVSRIVVLVASVVKGDAAADDVRGVVVVFKVFVVASIIVVD